MAFNRVAGLFGGNASAVVHTVQVSATQTKEVVSLFARLGPHASGPLGHRSLSVLDGVIGWEGADWENLGGEFSSDPVGVHQAGVLRSPGPAHRVFFRGLDNALWVKWSNGTSWFGPSKVGGEFTSDCAVVDSPHGIHVFVRGLDDQLWAFFYSPTSRGIEQMDLAPLGGSFPGNPRAVTDTSGRIHVFVRGRDGQLWRNLFDGARWQGFSSLHGPAFTGDPTPVFVNSASGSAVPGGLFAFVLPSAHPGVVYCRFHDDGSAEWSPLTAGELSRPVGSEPSGVNRAVGVIDVFARSPTGSLLHTGQTLSPVAEAPFPDWEDMHQGPFPGRPIIAAGHNQIHVFVRGLDNALWHMWWNGRSWS